MKIIAVGVSPAQGSTLPSVEAGVTQAALLRNLLYAELAPTCVGSEGVCRLSAA